jgi:hypothetical protein
MPIHKLYHNGDPNKSNTECGETGVGADYWDRVNCEACFITEKTRIHLGKKLWMEDDAMTFDRERVEGAWHRLFNHEFDLNKAIQKEDWGDANAYLMPNNKIIVLSFPGATGIYEMATNP